MNHKMILSFLAVFLIVSTSTAQASIFDDIMQRISPRHTPNPALPPSSAPVGHDARWASLSGDLLALNTQANIASLNEYMDAYDVMSVRVNVIDLQNSFDVVRTQGVVIPATAPQVDVQVRLTEGQVRQIIEMASDGKISSWEKIRIWLMLKRS